MDNFGNRMKDYEYAYRTKMPKRMPVIIRIDGKAFHTYTKGMTKPFSSELALTMWDTCKYLAQNIAGCKLAYHQSDEISLLITNYDKLETESWFDNNLQKMVSVAASLATAKFNEMAKERDLSENLALFDARAFVLPKEEVTNYFIWRQQDAIKNSISSLAQANFTHKELQHLNGQQMKDKLVEEKGVSWEDLPFWQQRGACITRKQVIKNTVVRNKWLVDFKTPVFSEQRNYIDDFVYLDED